MRHKFTTTLVMAAVLLLLGIYLVVVEIPHRKKADEAAQNADRLFDFKSEDVNAVELHYPSGGIELKKSADGKWRLTRPLQTDADQREVQSLVATVGDVRFTRVVEEKVQNMAEFGLAHPNADITLTLPDRAVRLLIGDDGPIPNTIYIQKDGDPRVVLAQQWIKGSLTRTAFDFRTKIILTIDHDKVDQVSLEFPKRTFQLDKQDKRWLLKKPVQAPADGDALDTLTLMLQNLRATAFIDPGPDHDKTLKGLKKPLVTVTTREPGDGAPKTQTARFYAATEKDSVYVVTDPDKPIYRVAKANMDELKPELFHYEDKRLVDVKTDAVKTIEVRTPADQYTLVSKDAGWAMQNPARPVKQDLVKRLLDQIDKLKAFQAVETPVKKPAAVGLKPPVDAIRLLDAKQKPLAELHLGRELKGMLYAQGNTPLGIALVNKDFLDEIPRKSELIKKEEPKKENKPDTKK
ncbi:MAG TPA: DUF4340 domain-containing protein [Nitrospiria bacterium]|nr:DUF4340 domain-containing protein [Nitrospiria bacterium]